MKTEALGIVLAAGNVLRCHTMPCINRSTIGLHTWRATILLYWLYGPDQSPPPSLIYTMIMHDTAEVHTGDIPGDIKASSSELKREFIRLEIQFEKDLGIYSFLLPERDRLILSLCDRAELMIYALDEADMGNRSPQMESMREAVHIMILDVAQRLRAQLIPPFPPPPPRLEELLTMLANRTKELKCQS